MATIEEVKERGLIQLYLWRNANEMIKSQYGHIKISEWLEYEQARIAQDPSRQAFVVKKGNLMALFVNNISVLSRSTSA